MNLIINCKLEWEEAPKRVGILAEFLIGTTDLLPTAGQVCLSTCFTNIFRCQFRQILYTHTLAEWERCCLVQKEAGKFLNPHLIAGRWDDNNNIFTLHFTIQVGILPETSNIQREREKVSLVASRTALVKGFMTQTVVWCLSLSGLIFSSWGKSLKKTHF